MSVAVVRREGESNEKSISRWKKKAQKAKQAQHSAIAQSEAETVTTVEAQSKTNMLPWALLALSWIGFIIYVTQI